ncbi:MAG: hypothetical protein OXG78_13090 [Chloroflexi bacterium]|nr:hypothetical protein [Chloroflexota bacterium]
MKNFDIVTISVMTVALLGLTTYAADITVDETCSLAEAITAANMDETVGGCIAGDGADVIVLTADVTLDAALPLAQSEITIEGGANTIDGDNRYHIYGIVAGAALTLNDLFITRAKSGWGGAIGNLGGVLNVTNCDFSDNSAGDGGAIGNEGRLTIRNSSFRYNSSQNGGGAIFNRGGVVHVINSNFEWNSAEGSGGAILNHDGWLLIEDKSQFKSNMSEYHGGALFNEDGTINISDSVFLRNRASDRSGGAIYSNIARDETDDLIAIENSAFLNNEAEENGGAIFNRRGVLLITNSAFDGNSAGDDGGGLFEASVDATAILHSTFHGNQADNGGGIYKEYNAQLSLSHTIIANSISGGDCFGRLDSNMLNLVEDGSCYAELSGDPLLGELVMPDDGSPAYYPLLPGSPAIDAASSDYCPDADQIGTARPQGEACDIGAVEYVHRE